MIRVRRHHAGPVEEMELGEFERRAREGDIAPQHEVCFPAVTGEAFVPARQLELFRGLYVAGTITFRRHFHLGRLPYLTLALIGVLVGAYLGWQGGAPQSTDDLLRQGAKSATLLVELGQWWRLLTANLLHVTPVHLAVNAFFLLNLGGPTEAIFRRLDYVLVLVASALGTTLLSAAANPAVSCGASGVVFGVWGAAAVFGVRHERILPERYRRYFITSVIPYSIVVLYLGFAMRGVDNWGHLGGLVAGSATAAFLPARLLQPHDQAAPFKLAALAVIALVLALGPVLAPGPGALSYARTWTPYGFDVPVPARWSLRTRQRDPGAHGYAFENHAGVGVAFEVRPAPGDAAGSVDALVRRFVEEDLARRLEGEEVLGLRLQDPEPARLAGLEARVVRAELLTPRGAMGADFWFAVHDGEQLSMSLSAPLWLEPAYRETFEAIRAGVRTTAPSPNPSPGAATR